MIETRDWRTDPPRRDGTDVEVRLRGGERNRVRWNREAGQWEALRRGKWAPMRDAHGAGEPVVWFDGEPDDLPLPHNGHGNLFA
jgi:hypothetical protein